MLRSLGFSVDYTGKGGTAAALITEITTELRGKKIFLPRSDRASAALVTQLKNVGADVTEVIAYRTLAIESIDLRNKRACGEADAILFFSSSGVQSFHALLRSGQLAHPKENVAIGAIGPVTLSELQVVGMPCHFQAREPALTEIVAALAKYFARHTMHSSSGVTAS
jgi:uroporphyrinogen-III synthase